MSARVTERAKRALSLASAEAIKLRHAYVGTEHILLALVREADSVAANVLVSMGVEPKTVQEQIAQVVAPGHEDPDGSNMPMTPKAKQAVETAADQAALLGHHYVGTEHLLLGLLLQEDGIAAQVLGTLGVDLGQIRDRIQQVLGGLGNTEKQNDMDLPELPQIGTDTQTTADSALSEADQLCLEGLENVPNLRALAQAAGQAMREKQAAVAAEEFERAAALRDALEALDKTLAHTRAKWPGAPD